jgi:Flagellar assembly protein T, C-terminal domain
VANSNSFKRTVALVSFSALSCLTVFAQSPGSTGSRNTKWTSSNVQLPEGPKPMMVATENELFCGGYLEYTAGYDKLQIVGGEQEQEKYFYAEGDYIYLNRGSDSGLKPGDRFSVVRPRSQFTSSFSKKKGYLGVMTQELGRVRVVSVKSQSSVAVVERACDNMLAGDLLQGVPQRTAPALQYSDNLDRFSEPSGKQVGRIVLARDAKEMPTTHDVVYIDLGQEDNIKPGDTFTIFRKPGTPSVARFRDTEIARSGSSGFESFRFKGGEYALQAQRSKTPEITGVDAKQVNTPDIKDNRPKVPRKIVGELVVLGVQQRTATAVITRVAQEVHTGDYVELK